MFSVVIFGLAVATAAMAQEMNAEGTTEVAANGENFPATISAENGVIITNGTPDKRCWVFIPVPQQSQQNNPNNPRAPYNYLYNMYSNNFRYPYYYYYGRRPGRRPNSNNNNNNNSNNNQNNNNQNLPEELPVYGADEVLPNREEFLQNGEQFVEENADANVQADFNSNNNVGLEYQPRFLYPVDI